MNRIKEVYILDRGNTSVHRDASVFAEHHVRFQLDIPKS